MKATTCFLVSSFFSARWLINADLLIDFEVAMELLSLKGLNFSAAPARPFEGRLYRVARGNASQYPDFSGFFCVSRKMNHRGRRRPTREPKRVSTEITENSEGG